MRHRRSEKNAAAMLSSAMRDSVAANPAGPLNSERLRIAWQMGPNRSIFDAWWQPRMDQAIGTPSEQAWLRAGVPFQGGQRLTTSQVSRLNLAAPGSAAAALEAGVVPVPGSPAEAELVQAILGGLCSETPVTAEVTSSGCSPRRISSARPARTRVPTAWITATPT
jgi:hypothetical protein